MQIYLAVTPDKLAKAARYTDRLAHVAYRVGGEGRLSRRDGHLGIRGGLMVLGDRDGGEIRDVPALCRDVWRECGNRGFSGVLADFEGPAAPDRAAFLESLGRVLSRNNRRLYVPETYGQAAPQAHVLICTALSGGEIRERLREAAETYGRSRVALDLQRLRMDFPLPCPGGEGTPLSGEALAALLAERGPAVFYSGDLGARYFTYRRDRETRFVLYDDAGTLRRKIQLGSELGYSAGVLMYPEVEDILGQLYVPRR